MSNFIKQLHESPRFKEALSLARSDEEKQQIIQVAESFVASFSPLLQELLGAAQNDKEFAVQLERHLNHRTDLLTHNDSVLHSGSTG